MPEITDQRLAETILDRATSAHPTLPPMEATLAFLDVEIAATAHTAGPSAELVALARDLLTNDPADVADRVRDNTGCSMLEAMAATFQAVHG